MIKLGNRGPPGPGQYNTMFKWGKSVLGSMKGGPRRTEIDIITKIEKDRPSTHSYSINYESTLPKVNYGKYEKGERLSTVS